MFFDIAEGEYKDFYLKQYRENQDKIREWPFDGIFMLNVPYEGCSDYVRINYNSFFSDLEDSNSGFICTDEHLLKGKVIGAKFRNEQTEYRGNIYDHTKMCWTCIADDVRNGKPGRMPNDKLIDPGPGMHEGFMSTSEDMMDDGLPF